MAFSSITVKDIKEVNKGMTAEAYTSLTTALATNGETSATYGGYFVMDERDDKYLLLFHNSDTDPHTVTIQAGDALQGVNSCALTIAASKYTALSIESGRFKRVSANEGYADLAKTIPHGISTAGFTEKGKVFFTSDSASVKAAIFKLPV